MSAAQKVTGRAEGEGAREWGWQRPDHLRPWGARVRNVDFIPADTRNDWGILVGYREQGWKAGTFCRWELELIWTKVVVVGMQESGQIGERHDKD